jgi:predicted Rossmann fold flavoprotein
MQKYYSNVVRRMVMSYDVIIVGAGSSGLMAAVSAGETGAKVLLLDKGDKLGRKLGISGGGRCNVTNAKELDELIKHIPGNGKYLHSALATFSNRHIMDFFEKLGIALKEEDNGRMFPVTDKAKTVVDALVGKVRSLGVDIRVGCPVDRVLYESGRAVGVRLKSGERVSGGSVIVAVGGKSVPHTGSTGDGYAKQGASGLVAPRSGFDRVERKRKSSHYARRRHDFHPFRLVRAHRAALQPVRREGAAQKRGRRARDDRS